MEMEAPVEIEATNERGSRRLNNVVAITIALLATFMGICRIKSDNVFLAMQEAQANRIDSYMWYQARNIRQDIAGAAAAQLALQSQSGASKAAATFKATEAKENAKKQQQLEDAQAAEKRYDHLGLHREQLDLGEASIAISIAVLAITSLTQKKWLYYMALIPAILGVVMGIAGFANWNLRWDMLARFLGA
jgi:hypothetical protein